MGVRVTGRFEEIFGAGTKPLIAMAHLGPLPGTPLYDEALGVQGIVDGVARDLDVLLRFPFDAVMFCKVLFTACIPLFPKIKSAKSKDKTAIVRAKAGTRVNILFSDGER